MKLKRLTTTKCQKLPKSISSFFLFYLRKKKKEGCALRTHCSGTKLFIVICKYYISLSICNIYIFYSFRFFFPPKSFFIYYYICFLPLSVSIFRASHPLISTEIWSFFECNILIQIWFNIIVIFKKIIWKYFHIFVEIIKKIYTYYTTTLHTIIYLFLFFSTVFLKHNFLVGY